MTISFLTVHFTKTSLTFNGRLPWWAPLVGKKAPGTSVVQNVAILHTVHVPDWFERVVLRKQRVRVTYIGSSQFWKVYPNGPRVINRQARQLGAFEKMFRAKKKSTLKFK